MTATSYHHRFASALCLGWLVTVLALPPVAFANDGTDGTSGPAQLDSDTGELFDSQDPPHYVALPNGTVTLTGHGTTSIPATEICTATPGAGACPIADTNSSLNSWITALPPGALPPPLSVYVDSATNTTSATQTGTLWGAQVPLPNLTVTGTGTGTGTATLTSTHTAFAWLNTTATGVQTYTAVYYDTLSNTAMGTSTITVTVTGTGTVSLTNTGTGTTTQTSTAVQMVLTMNAGTETNFGVGTTTPQAKAEIHADQPYFAGLSVYGETTMTQNIASFWSGNGARGATILPDGSLMLGKLNCVGCIGSGSLLTTGALVLSGYPTLVQFGNGQTVADNSGGGLVLTTAGLGSAQTLDVRAWGMRVLTGDLTVAAGNETISAGNLTLSAGNETISAGNLTLSAGNETVAGKVAGANVNINGGAPIGIVGTTITPALGHFSTLVESSITPNSVCVAANGNVYIGSNANIYMQTAGMGAFNVVGPGAGTWQGCAVNGTNVYFANDGVDIYEQVGGTGSFAALGAGALNWYGMTAANGNVYAAVYGGDIYMQTGGSGAFSALGVGNKGWVAMAAQQSGSGVNVYASTGNTTNGGSIWTQTGGSGSFALSFSSLGSVYVLAVDLVGNLYYGLAGTGGDIYELPFGAGSFVPLRETTQARQGMSAAPNGQIYVGVHTGAASGLYLRTPSAATLITPATSGTSGQVLASAGNANPMIWQAAFPVSQTIQTTGPVTATTGTATTTATSATLSNTVTIGVNVGTAAGSVAAGNDSRFGSWTGTATLTTFIPWTGTGTGTNQVIMGNDARLSDSRTPTGSIYAGTGLGVTTGTGTATGTVATLAGSPTFVLTSTNTGTGNLVGTLTTNTIPKASGAQSLANSSLTDNGSNVATMEPVIAPSAQLLGGAPSGTAGTTLLPSLGHFTTVAYSGEFNQICVTASGNIYGVVHGDQIYEQVGGVGSWTAVGPHTGNWAGCTVNGTNIYAAEDGGDIWMQTGGTGAFSDISSALGTKRWWSCGTSTAGNVYCVVYAADIWMQTGGAGAFASLSQGNKTWTGIAGMPNGNVVAITDAGVYYVQTGGAGGFASSVTGLGVLYGLAVDPANNVFISAYNGGISEMVAGTSSFVSLGETTRTWQGMGASPNSQMIYAGSGSTVYARTPASPTFVLPATSGASGQVPTSGGTSQPWTWTTPLATGTTASTALAGNTTHLSGDVATSVTVNGKALSGNITITATDVGAIGTNTVTGTRVLADVSSGVVTGVHTMDSSDVTSALTYTPAKTDLSNLGSVAVNVSVSPATDGTKDMGSVSKHWNAGYFEELFSVYSLDLGLAAVGNGTLNFNGVTSGTVTLQPALAAGTYTLTLPTVVPATGQVLCSASAGTLGWCTPAGGSSFPTSSAGWLHDNGSGTRVWSTPSYSDVGALPTSAVAIGGGSVGNLAQFSGTNAVTAGPAYSSTPAGSIVAMADGSGTLNSWVTSVPSSAVPHSARSLTASTFTSGVAITNAGWTSLYSASFSGVPAGSTLDCTAQALVQNTGVTPTQCEIAIYAGAYFGVLGSAYLPGSLAGVNQTVTAHAFVTGVSGSFSVYVYGSATVNDCQIPSGPNTAEIDCVVYGP